MILFFIICTVLLFYLPVLISPEVLLNRGNDLEEQFWPAFYFIKQQFFENQNLPLWNNMWFSGTPLLPDPQFSLFYPPHIIFLLLPTDLAFITSFLLHTLVGGIGAYLLSRQGLGMSRLAGLFSSLLYITSPKLVGFLGAGHPGLVMSWGWLPWVILAAVMIARRPGLLWSAVLSISLAGIFYAHTIIFAIAVISTTLIFMTSLVIYGKDKIKSVLFFGASSAITFGLFAIAFLPQFEWITHTTRFLLLQDRDVYPKWAGAGEFISSVLFPWISGISNVWDLDSEKWIVLGILPTLLALIGFWNLQIKFKLLLALVGIVTVFVALNNVSPLYQILISQDWYVLARVATRIWFIPILVITFLAGFELDNLTKNNKIRKLIPLIIILSISELLGLSWLRLAKPIEEQNKFVQQGVYEFLKTDNEKFRVFCVNRCLSQKETAKYNLELVEGYNTLVQTNYYKHMWQLTGTFWNYYTLSIPPIGVYISKKIKPDAASLGSFNVKYIISPYQLNGNDFSFEEKIGDYFIYKNNLVLHRSYFWTDDQKPVGEAAILKYSPNQIRVDTSKKESSRLVLAEVWSPGWKAYLNGKEKVSVQEMPNTLRLVDIKKDTEFVDFKYDPESFRTGKLITLFTLMFLFVYGIKKLKILK